VGEEEKNAGPGEVVHIPEGTLHELQNRGEIPLVYLSFKNRSGDWPPPEAIQD
jgi:mannose-6-phosphate isomerase-like protein (cupin superfamily)